MKFKLDLECQDNKISTFEVETNVGYASEENYDTRIFYKGSEIKANNRRNNDYYLANLTIASEVTRSYIYNLELDKNELDFALDTLKFYPNLRASYEYYKNDRFGLELELISLLDYQDCFKDSFSSFLYDTLEKWNYIEQFIALEADYIADCKMDGKIPYKE